MRRFLNVAARLAMPALFFLVSSAGKTQILYKVNFHDKNYNRYDGLLVYFNESSAYMRIGYNSADNRYHVVNVQYKSQTGTYNDGSSYYFMTGSAPRFITENSKDQQYNPDYFIWRKGKYETDWKLPSTTDDPKLKIENEIPVDSFYQLDPYKVKETYLRRFYWTNEQEFIALKKFCGLEVSPVTNPTNTNTDKAKLHLVVVANTLIGDIGPSCASDRDKLDYEFRSIADALNMQYRKYVVDGDRFNKQNVQSVLSSLAVGTNDIILFIYRGHGFRWNNQSDAYPMLDLRSSNYMSITQSTSIALSEVYNTLKRKNARLNIVLADCCNNNIGLNQVTSTSFLNLQADNKPDISKLRRLFMSARGSLISAAAKSGEYSWANPFGGFYTLSFLQALKEKISYMDNSISGWSDIINYTTRLAREKSSPSLCSNCTIQSGVSYVNVAY